MSDRVHKMSVDFGALEKRIAELEASNADLSQVAANFKAQLDVALEENSGNMVLINRAFAERDAWEEMAERLHGVLGLSKRETRRITVENAFRKLKEGA